MEMHLVDRHLVNRRLDLGEPLKERLRAVASARGQRRLIDQAKDLRQAPVGVVVMLMVMLMSGLVVVSRVAALLSTAQCETSCARAPA